LFLIKVACASHFMQFKRGRHLLRYRATGSRLTAGAVDGAQRGEFVADADGALKSQNPSLFPGMRPLKI
jgi:hypothetical protein